MGIPSFSDVKEALSRLFGSGHVVPPVRALQVLASVTHLFDDVEATQYAATCGATDPEDLLNRMRGWLDNALMDYPAMRCVGCFYDYGPNKPSGVKDVLRGPAHFSAPTVQIDDDHVDDLRLSKCARASSDVADVIIGTFMAVHMRFYMPSTFQQLVQSLMRISKWRQDARVLFANAADERACTFRAKGGQFFVSSLYMNSTQTYVDVENGQEIPTPSSRAGEGEAAIVQAAEKILREDPAAIVMCRTTDSDALMIALLAIARGGIRAEDASRFFLRIGSVLFDVGALRTAIVEWGSSRGIDCPIEALLVTIAVGGSDFVRKPSGVSAKNLIQRFETLGCGQPRLCAGMASGPPRFLVAGWLKRDVVRAWLLTIVATQPAPARDEDKPPPKRRAKTAPNPRVERYVDIAEGRLMPNQLALDVVLRDACNAKKGYVSVPANYDTWFETLVGQTIWQIAYWAMSPTGAFPNPLSKSSGTWDYGWKYEEGKDGTISVVALDT